MSKMSLEQFKAFAQNLPEGADQKKLARALGVELPPKPLSEQLQQVKLVKHTPKPSKNIPNPSEMTYVEIPSLDVGDTTLRSIWVRSEVARAVFKRGLEVCDQHKL